MLKWIILLVSCSLSYGGNMQISKKGLAQLAGEEGCCTAPYWDAAGGIWTFGIGITRYDAPPNPEDMEKGKDMKLDYCFSLFYKKLQKYVGEVNNHVHVEITQEQFDALVSFHYNTGSIGRATLTSIINNGRANEMSDDGVHTVAWNAFMMWVTPSAVRSRRVREANLFQYGRYELNGRVLITTADRHGHEHGAYEINALSYIDNIYPNTETNTSINEGDGGFVYSVGLSGVGQSVAGPWTAGTGLTTPPNSIDPDPTTGE
ncbi:Glycoside hydrolase, family 24 [uncultured Caudovirales phage]|uniref:Lysozyme n=1 Tax=uncultured Caudovirales phage TaxID=2100421 RepID=A0A6J5KJ55_9CAUD|nr:Glycoside hydrolase, family 24 [uncultured Caudovirales phage]